MANITQISGSSDLSTLSGTKLSSSSSTTSSTSTTTDSSKTKSDQLKNQFLNILLTQMQHQNPLDPMDTKEFTGQLTQFSALEQQIDTNTKLDTMVSALKQNTVTTAFNYIGQYVDLNNATTAMQNNAAHWTYALPADAANVNLKITDASGKTLYSGAMQNTSGGSSISKGTYNFDITNADLTTAQADGTVLKFEVTATDAKGKPVTGTDGKAIVPTIHTTVKVESVQSDSTGTYLQAGGILFAIGDVKKIVTAPTTTTTTA